MPVRLAGPERRKQKLPPRLHLFRVNPLFHFLPLYAQRQTPGILTVSIVALLKAISTIHAWAFLIPVDLLLLEHCSMSTIKSVSTSIQMMKGVHIILSINGHFNCRMAGWTVSFQMLDTTDVYTIQTKFLHGVQVLVFRCFTVDYPWFREGDSAQSPHTVSI